MLAFPDRKVGTALYISKPRELRIYQSDGKFPNNCCGGCCLISFSVYVRITVPTNAVYYKYLRMRVNGLNLKTPELVSSWCSSIQLRHNVTCLRHDQTWWLSMIGIVFCARDPVNGCHTLPDGGVIVMSSTDKAQSASYSCLSLDNITYPLMPLFVFYSVFVVYLLLSR